MTVSGVHVSTIKIFSTRQNLISIKSRIVNRIFRNSSKGHFYGALGSNLVAVFMKKNTSKLTVVSKAFSIFGRKIGNKLVPILIWLMIDRN